MTWFAKPYSEALEHYDIKSDFGLDESQVKKMRSLYGENILIAQKPEPWWKLLLRQFNNPIIYILIIAALINAAIADFKDAVVIGAVVILNTVIGFVQERKASDALKALRNMAAPSARVIRSGIQVTIPASEVVVGDLIMLESGVRVPADARLVESNNLLVDESMLTGESFSVTKDQNARISPSAPLGDRITYVYSGTIIQKGRGVGLVTAVGTQTEFGQISEKVAEAEEAESPLQTQIAKFGKGLSIGILITVIAIFIVGFLRGNDIITMFMTSIGLAVSAIPEGLPVSVTITLSIGIYQMAKYRAIVKRLAAVETLGSTNVICTDKTGTLTKNQMVVTRYYAGGEDFIVTGSGYNKEGYVIYKNTGSIIDSSKKPGLNLASIVGYVCSEASITENGKEWDIQGDPTEVALMIASKKMHFECNSNCSKFMDIPFESENQLMAVRAQLDEQHYVLSKGAPEKILARCSNMLDSDGGTLAIDKEELEKKVAEFSENGWRVLALAYSNECCPEPLSLETLSNLTFIGFAAIEDSVRPEAVKAVKECHEAGIRVVMITGDHKKTAQSVSKTVGIGIGKERPVAVTGTELDEMNDEELYRHVPEIDVYARVAPHHKYRIVKQLQKHDNIVAMTGDGVNDAPALKQANIGVAMGSGTDVAKEAAHLILMDDNFATIVEAIRRGRVILKNLQHILFYILATSFGGLLTIAASVAIGFPLPVLAAQLLWINLVTDGTSTFPLAFEREHGSVMVFPPRKKHENLITGRMIRRMLLAGVVMMIGTLGVFYFSANDIFHPTQYELLRSRTMAFCTLAFFQIWNVQNSRSPDRSIFFNLPYTQNYKLDRVAPIQNPILLGVMLFAISLQVSAVTLPFMNNILNTVPLTAGEWGIVLGSSFSIIVIMEAAKFTRAYLNKINKKHRIITIEEQSGKIPIK